jgi:hypothetical protein
VYDTLQKDGTPFPLFACKGGTNHNSGTTLLKTVGGSNPVLGEKPRKKKLCFGSSTKFPHHFVHDGGGRAKEWHLISGLCRVSPSIATMSTSTSKQWSLGFTHGVAVDCKRKKKRWIGSVVERWDWRIGEAVVPM